MAPPFLVVDHAVQYFHYQWNCGVQPSLTLKTSADGSIEISTTVRSSIPDRPFLQQSHCSKSGQTSRARRRTKREQSFHQAAEVEVAIMQPHLVSNNKSNMEVLPKSLEQVGWLQPSYICPSLKRDVEYSLVKMDQNLAEIAP